MAVLFISDLHLSPQERPAIVEQFLQFLETADAQELYILGDFFEYWIGDDALGEAHWQPVIQGLKAISARGVAVHVMHGNRDFLLGEGFAAATGCRLLADPAIIDLYGTPTLLVHGDTLCTDDVEYQQVRKQVRRPEWIQAFLAKSAIERNALVRNYREQSRQVVSSKAPEIMDVNPQTVMKVMRVHQVRHLIHGHTHRPGRHEFLLEGVPAVRMVLGDWYEQGSVLRCDKRGWRLHTLN